MDTKEIMKLSGLVAEYVNKHDLLQVIETDIAEGKLPVVAGNLLIRYVMQLPVGNAAAIVETAKREAAYAEYLDAVSELGAAVGVAFRKAKEYAEVLICQEKAK